jgi:polyphenol oxidase
LEYQPSRTVRQIAEESVPGPVPRFEIPGWRERHGVLAGITSRGSEEGGRGFDLGLWSRQPVGEVMNRWSEFRRAISGFHAFILGNQIHGTEVRRLDQVEGWVQVQGVDGWVTTTPGVLLSVTVADCVPVYLVAPGRGVALLHAGWRGTAGGILDRGVKALTEASGATEAELTMHCGVGICGDCYEVGSEVMAGCRVPAPGDGPWHLDLRSVLTKRGLEIGLSEVTSSTWCSAHHRPLFYSHRASGGADGRMVAYVGMTGRREDGKVGKVGLKADEAVGRYA